MDRVKKALPFLKSRKEKEEEEEISSNFLKNGSLMLEELIKSFGGRYNLPIKSFTAKELISASNNFSEEVIHLKGFHLGYRWFRGNLEGRPILVNLYSKRVNDIIIDGAIRDIVISSQMSHLKNVLKMIGCCFEFESPAIVCEYSGTELLSDCIDAKLLSWRSRIKIAKDIANVVCYLHSAFPTPIISRNLKPRKVIIDQSGVAKLFDFTLSISLPQGELRVEDEIVGTFGYIDPQYFRTSFVTEKADVYSFGVLMLELFTGKRAIMDTEFLEVSEEHVHIRDYTKSCLVNAQINKILDPKDFEGESNDELRQNLLAILNLALRCTEEQGIDRPEMLDVAKELLRIEKSVCTISSTNTG